MATAPALIPIAPFSASVTTQPAVGIFWQVSGVLVIDRSSLDEAEPYGECLTHGAGHYELWQSWQALGPARLRSLGYPPVIASSEYDDWPRGRVVYEVPIRRFVIYADRRLQPPRIINALKSAFCLVDCDAVVKSDLHYR